MSTKKSITFTVTTSNNDVVFTLVVGRTPVRVVNGVGTINKTAGRKHILLWATRGNVGDSISITGTAGGQEVVKISKSKVGDGGVGGGARRFDLPA